jgi:hypothetical protein
MRRPFQRFIALLFISVSLFLFIPSTSHAKADVIQKMNGLHVPYVANEWQIDEKVEFTLKPFTT